LCIFFHTDVYVNEFYKWVGLDIEDYCWSFLHLSVSWYDVRFKPSFGRYRYCAVVFTAQLLQLLCGSDFDVLMDALGLGGVPSLLSFLVLLGTA
jgi:hypothetical protein